MSLYNYVDTPNSNLICCICRAPFLQPTTALSCAHTFCYDCINQALAHSPICPVDRSPLSVSDLVEVGGIVRALVDELMVECPHKWEGCETTCQRQVVSVHLREDCLFGEMRCQVERCEKRMKRREMEVHLREVHEVGEETEEETEKKRQVKENDKCPHAIHGCPFSADSQNELTVHLSSCVYESFKNYISMSNAKMALLTEQNMILRQRLEKMEGMMKEVGVMKGVLGPWVKTASQGSVRNAPSNDVSQPSDSERHEGSPNYFAANQSPAQIIAPLDLGNTLEGTLYGLRESMVGLAGMIDGIRRRGEMALANETLRLGEETMSLRAQIHGVRMQVHGMMIERNAMAIREYAVASSTITKL